MTPEPSFIEPRWPGRAVWRSRRGRCRAAESKTNSRERYDVTPQASQLPGFRHARPSASRVTGQVPRVGKAPRKGPFFGNTDRRGPCACQPADRHRRGRPDLRTVQALRTICVHHPLD